MKPETKYQGIAAALRAEIVELAAAGQAFLPSERELTARFGVDRSTIRRALDLLEEEGLILRSPGRRSRIMARPGEPETSGRHLRVALVVNAAPRGWATLPVLHGAESVLAPQGVELSVYSSYAHTPAEAALRERQRLEFCLRRKVSGVILWPAAEQGSEAVLMRLRTAGIPVVLIDQELPGLDLDFVGIDNVAAAYQATQHLILSGHTRVAHISRNNRMPTTLQRIAGYRRALADHGISFRDSWLRRCEPGAEETRAVDELMAGAERVTALLAINDMTALRLLRHLLQRGVRVPEEMAVMGIDDLLVDELAAVPLSTVHQPFESIGSMAAQILLDRIQGRKGPPEVRRLPTRLVVRASCGGAVRAVREVADPRSS